MEVLSWVPTYVVVVLKSGGVVLIVTFSTVMRMFTFMYSRSVVGLLTHFIRYERSTSVKCILLDRTVDTFDMFMDLTCYRFSYMSEATMPKSTIASIIHSVNRWLIVF